jgi:purine-binding chemotaxis protein CheW
VSAVHVQLRVGGERYALPVEQVRSVLDADGVTPVLGAPAAVLGLRVHEGQLLPVFRLAALLGVTAAEPRRIVVAADGGRSAGFAVDDVLDVGELPAAREEAPASDRLAGAVLADGALVGVVDLTAVLDALEAELTA